MPPWDCRGERVMHTTRPSELYAACSGHAIENYEPSRGSHMAIIWQQRGNHGDHVAVVRRSRGTHEAIVD